VSPAELPWFLGLMEHLARRGLHLPARRPRPRTARRCASSPAAMPPSPPSCPASGRAASARSTAPPPSAPRWPRLHVAGERLRRATRTNALGPDRLGALLDRCVPPAPIDVTPGLGHRLPPALGRIFADWPQDLPTGHIHADLFPDSAFFLDGRLSGLIDFYFAALTTSWPTTLAVSASNAWRFEHGPVASTPPSARQLLAAYEATRPLSPGRTPPPPPSSDQGAAFRFAAHRLYDWINQPPGALRHPQGPARIRPPPRASTSPRGTSTPMASDDRPRRSRLVEIWTDGACKRQPRPRRLGRRAALQAATSANSPATSPRTTNNRMELAAAAEALEALKRPCSRRAPRPSSQYPRNGTDLAAHTGRARKNWRNAAADPVPRIRISGVASWHVRQAQHEIDCAIGPRAIAATR
jgi:homoserine kinase type II